MKQILKRLFKKFKKRYAGAVLPGIIRSGLGLLYTTMRVDVRGYENAEAFHSEDRGVIFGFWHSMILLAGFPYRGRGAHVLVSRHGDGELIGQVMQRMGFSLVRGSSSKGGSAALRELVAVIRQNRDVVITPDGPRGPAERVKPGIAQLARLTGAPVIPVAFSGSRLRILNTWDRFRIPCPFSRIVFVIGAPVYCREEEDLEESRKRIEDAISGTTERADAYFRR